MDATHRFDPKCFAHLITPAWKSREKLINLRIDDFLLLAKPGMDADKAHRVETLLDHGTLLESLPHLLAFSDANGDLRVDGHEGRHRARALKALGYETMPVLLRTDIRWSEQDQDFKIDYRATWPAFIVAEEGGARIPMPVKRQDATAPYSHTDTAKPSACECAQETPAPSM